MGYVMEDQILAVIEKTQKLNSRHLDDSDIAYQILIDLKKAGFSIVKTNNSPE